MTLIKFADIKNKIEGSEIENVKIKDYDISLINSENDINNYMGRPVQKNDIVIDSFRGPARSLNQRVMDNGAIIKGSAAHKIKK